MPYKSVAQMHKMFALEKEGKVKRGTAMKWAHETRNITKLPKRVHGKKAKRKEV
jgi:hypothetical protein